MNKIRETIYVPGVHNKLATKFPKFITLSNIYHFQTYSRTRHYIYSSH